MQRRITQGLAVVAAVGLLGCPSTRQARTVQPSGFLGESASLLQEGGPGQPKLYYVAAGVPFQQYTRLLLDPVTVWRDPQTKGVSEKDAQALANNFHRLLYEALSTDFEIVESPQSGTLRLQVALTQLHGSDVVLNVVSSAVPQLRVVTGLEGYATDDPLFTGDAGMAFKITDASDGKLLSEGADGRVGAEHVDDSWEKWSDVDASMKFWASMFRYDLCQLQKRTDCVAPKADKTF